MQPNSNGDFVRRLEVTSLVLLLLAPTRAHAGMFGEENAALVALVAQGAEQISQGIESFNKLKQQYEELKAMYETGKKVAGMAQDAVNGFNEFKKFADTVTTSPDKALYQIFPDAQTLRSDLSSPDNWARGTGELQRLMRVCLEGGGKCAEFHQAVTAKMAKDAISGTYGTSPVKRDDVESLDVEAADAISKATAAQAASALSEVQSRALRTKCVSGTDSEAIAACQAAGAIGALMNAEQTAILNQQLAESNRLQALQIAQKNYETKRRLQEVIERTQAVDTAAQKMAPDHVRFQGALNTGMAR